MQFSTSLGSARKMDEMDDSNNSQTAPDDHCSDALPLSSVLTRGSMVTVQDGMVSRSNDPTTTNEDFVYMVPVLRARGQAPGQTWRVGRVVHSNLDNAILMNEVEVTRYQDIIPPSLVQEDVEAVHHGEEQTAASYGAQIAALESYARSTKKELPNIISSREKKRRRKYHSDLNEVCGSSHSRTLNESLLRVGREISVVQLENCKLLVGVAPRRVPPLIKAGNAVTLKGTSDKELVLIQDDIIEKVPAGGWRDNQDAKMNLSKEHVGKSKRTERQSEIISRSVKNGVILLMNTMLDRISAETNNFGDFVLFGRVPPGVRLGVIYAVPTHGSQLRSVCVVIALPKKAMGDQPHVGCVRFMARSSEKEENDG